MRRPKLYFTIPCRNQIWLWRSILFIKAVILIATLYIIINTIQSYLVAALILFLAFFILKLVPMPFQNSIDVYYDRLVYKTKIKEVELYFSQIAFIDQDVVSDRKDEPYYQGIEFLDESMKSLLYIEGIGYSYEGLVTLCNRICSINQEFTSFKNTTSAFDINFDEKAEI
ncbi:hypothetical protein ACIQ1D_18695 [Lysinibacillus xylanilyticus]|uniref:hypothetical protein n=1 Tax=Lysinibacillus xylanilyticus TaxID=582475 RepID=UPI00380AD6EE